MKKIIYQCLTILDRLNTKASIILNAFPTLFTPKVFDLDR